MTRDEIITLGVTGGSHLTVHSQMLVFPTILMVIQGEFGAGLDKLGLMAALSGLMFGLGAIPAGYLESRWGGRTLLLIYQIGSALSALMIMLAPTLITLTVGMVFLGLFSSIYHPAGLTIISRKIRNISKGMAYHGIAGSSGLALGPILASGFTDLISWRAAYGSMAVLNCILAGLTLLFVSNNRAVQDNSDSENTIATNRPVLTLYYGITILIGLAYAGFSTFMPIHFTLNTRELFQFLTDTLRGGLFTTLVLAAGVIGQFLGGYLGSRYARANLLVWIVALNIPFLVFMGMWQGVPLIGSALLLGIVHFSYQPVGNTMIAQYTHSQDRGLGYGISFFLSFGVGSLAAGLSGLIAERMGVSYVFPAMAAVLVPGVILAIMLRKTAGRAAGKVPTQPGF